MSFRVGVEQHAQARSGLYSFYQGYELLIWERDHDAGTVNVAQPLTLKAMKPEQAAALPEPPTIHLTNEAAQELMDTLYQCGVRPSGARDSTGQVEALKDHLEDMREMSRRLLDQLLAPLVVKS